MKLPMTKVGDLQVALEPYRERYGAYLKKMRPWKQFFSFAKPEGDLKARLEANLTHFQINYAIIFLIQCIWSLVMNPHCMAVVAVLVIVWMWFLKKNDDPDWEVNIGGINLGKTQRWLVLCALSAVAFLVSAGNLLFSAAFAAGCLIAVHGMLHPVPTGYDTDAAFDGVI